MPRGRKPDGEHALSNAERQARYRAHRLKQLLTYRDANAPVDRSTQPPTTVGRRDQRAAGAAGRVCRLAHGSARPRHATVPPPRHQAIADLDLTALAEIMPPRGYGRD